ncbi:MAG: sulfoxide reductase heme-binding subunit YedZ [Gammaproteobacteria bacterium]|jgi:sulfoxide reductase heme-binding subunit YedZ|nr:sulfoxide reductase heme-binding subunit YedZ [Gammaproteobacteria bacterium]
MTAAVDPRRARRRSEQLALLTALLPLVWMASAVLEIFGQSLGPNPSRELLHSSGKTALNALLITLTLRPLQQLTGRIEFLWLRRMAGLTSFSYATLHLLVYAVLELGLDWSDLGNEIAQRPFIIVGLIALIGMIPMAATSTDRAMRRLGRRWRQWHYAIYPVAILAVWHYYWQVKLDVTEPLIYAGILALLFGYRLYR